MGTAKLCSAALEEFKQLYLKEYGVALDDNRARYKAEKLLIIMNAVYQSIKQADFHKYGKSKENKETK